MKINNRSIEYIVGEYLNGSSCNEIACFFEVSSTSIRRCLHSAIEKNLVDDNTTKNFAQKSVENVIINANCNISVIKKSYENSFRKRNSKINILT